MTQEKMHCSGRHSGVVARVIKDESLPAAFSTTMAFLATLFVLLVGTILETRPWILILRAASAFFLVSAMCRVLIAGWAAISSSIRTKELKTKGVS